MAKYIKITQPTGLVSFALSNADLYKRLNFQNESRSSSTKFKIQEVEMTEEEVSKHSGFDENAAIELNPVSANLLAVNQSQDKRISELEAALELAYNETQKAKTDAGTQEVKETKSKK